MKIGDKVQSADWKKEKHAPSIDCPDEVKAGEFFELSAGLGKEIAHPNTLEHHISWVQVYFVPEGDKFAYDLGRFEFNAHSEAGALTAPMAKAKVQLAKSGTILALAHCNIHGLWESSKEIKVS